LNPWGSLRPGGADLALLTLYALFSLHALGPGGAQLSLQALNALLSLNALRAGKLTQVLPRVSIHVPDIQIGADIVGVALHAGRMRSQQIIQRGV
jgi:hypothetical protein